LVDVNQLICGLAGKESVLCVAGQRHSCSLSMGHRSSDRRWYGTPSLSLVAFSAGFN